MLMIGNLIQTMGRLLAFGGALSAAFGLLLIFISPPGLAERLGGWFLASGALSALLSVIPGYVGDRLEDLAGQSRPRLRPPGQKWRHYEYESESKPDSPAPDRSGLFGGDYHHDMAVWITMHNSQEQGCSQEQGW